MRMMEWTRVATIDATIKKQFVDDASATGGDELQPYPLQKRHSRLASGKASLKEQ